MVVNQLTTNTVLIHQIQVLSPQKIVQKYIKKRRIDMKWFGITWMKNNPKIHLKA